MQNTQLLLRLLLLLLLLCSPLPVHLQWYLNHSFVLQTPPPAPSEIWPLEHYGSSMLAYPFFSSPGSNSTPFSSVFLCFIASSAPAQPNSSAPRPASYTLSIYVVVYDLVQRGAIIWSASPSALSTPSLTLQNDGDLVLRSGDGLVVWSTNTAHKGVVRMDFDPDPQKVNLILYGSNDTIVWQSFDHPSDTLTMNQNLQPGMKLVSWASSTDPSEGPYSLVMEPGGLALYGSFPDPQPYWIWGFYGLNDTFSVMHTCRNNMMLSLSLLGALLLSPDASSKSDASWSRLCLLDMENRTAVLPFQKYETADFRANDVTFLRLEPDGNLRAYTLGSAWTTQLDLFDSNPCLLPRYCGPYGVCTFDSQCACPSTTGDLFSPLNSSQPSRGCPITRPLSCHNSSAGSPRHQQMLNLTGIDFFANKYLPPVSNISTQQTCRDECHQNCSCLAAFWHAESRSCFHVDQMGSLQGSLRASYQAFLKVETPPASKGSIYPSISAMAALLICWSFVFYMCRRQVAALREAEEEDAFLDNIPGLPTRFSYKELQSVTNGFDQKLGKGGFGAVYAGMLSNGTKVAVKQLEGVRQGDKEFRSEVAIMGGIHHYHLLRLLGFCAQGSHRLLVYEYMENGSLDRWLFSEGDMRTRLSWDLRYKIALGAARGLAYLHEECRERIIHLDIKPQNILVDENFVAKVADFGLSRLVGRDESRVVTNMRGTPGYLAPEWLKEGSIDEKCDVFSFGMLLMEIISGRKNLDLRVAEEEKIYFPEWAFWKVQEAGAGAVAELTDAELEKQEDIAQVRRMINTAFLCVLEDPGLRPSMEKVVQMLEGHVPISELQLSSLFQGLTFVLKSPGPSSFARAQIERAVFNVIESSSSYSLLTPPSSTSGGAMSSFEISTR